MPKPDDKLALLDLAKSERAGLPLGYNRIYFKTIASKDAEIAATVYSTKYRKKDLFSVASEKPISKILAWKGDGNDD